MSRPYDTEAEAEYERDYWEELHREEWLSNPWRRHWREYYATEAPPEEDDLPSEPDGEDTSK